LTLLSLHTSAKDNKEGAKRRIIRAVGEILKTEGYSGLRVTKIARKAGVDRKLIGKYFTSLNRLIGAFILENDYWMIFKDKVKDILNGCDYADSESLITDSLQNQFKFYFTGKVMQTLILLEISGAGPLLHSIHNAKERLGQKLLELTPPTSMVQSQF
jgi:hypothetical protein